MAGPVQHLRRRRVSQCRSNGFLVRFRSARGREVSNTERHLQARASAERSWFGECIWNSRELAVLAPDEVMSALRLL